MAIVSRIMPPCPAVITIMPAVGGPSRTTVHSSGVKAAFVVMSCSLVHPVAAVPAARASAILPMNVPEEHCIDRAGTSTFRRRGQRVGNAVVHFEVGAADDGPLVAFYGELFGWGLQGFSGGGYTMVDTRGGGGINGGIGQSRTGEPWSTFYVETGDLQATLDKANSLGGTTVMPVTDFGGTVTIAMFNDPDGLLVGLVQAAAEPARGEGPGPSAGSGAPVTWFE